MVLHSVHLTVRILHVIGSLFLIFFSADFSFGRSIANIADFDFGRRPGCLLHCSLPESPLHVVFPFSIELFYNALTLCNVLCAMFFVLCVKLQLLHYLQHHCIIYNIIALFTTLHSCSKLICLPPSLQLVCSRGQPLPYIGTNISSFHRII